MMRWIVAGIAAAALAWTVLVAELPWIAADTDIHPPAGEACAADTSAGADGAPAAPIKANLAFTLQDVDGNTVHLADYQGKVVLLDFWATWCGPCKVEIPWFVEFQEKYGPQGLQVIGVSVDDTVEKLKPFMADMKMNYLVLQGLGHDDLMDAYGPMLGLPTTALISRDGTICAKHTGLVPKDELEAQIKALL